MAPIPLLVIRSGLSMLDKVSPRLAGKAAFRLFCRTPSRRVRGEKQRALLASARHRVTAARRTDLKIPGGTVASYRFAADRPDPASRPVLVVHGWSSRSEHMLALVEAIRRSGHDVVTIDLPGHGRSSGRTLHVPLGVRAVQAAWRHHGPFAAMVGHSFGGVVVVNAAQGSVAGIEAMKPERLVLISAPASMPKLFAGVARWLGISGPARQAFQGEVLRLTSRPLEQFDGLSQLAELAVPTLVMHARDDKEVGSEQAEIYAAAGPHVRLHWADGLGHRRIIGAPSVARLAASFIEETGDLRCTHAAANRGAAAGGAIDQVIP